MGKRKYPYYYINDLMQVKPDIDNGGNKDKLRKLLCNYFTSESDARTARALILKALNSPTDFISNIRIDILMKKLDRN